MKWTLHSLLSLSLFSCTIIHATGSTNPLDNWHQWRGPLTTGAAPRGNPPLKWDAKTNLKWKVAIPGKSSATPIVWEDQVFTVTAYDTKQKADPKDIPNVKTDFVVKTQPPTTYYEFVVYSFDRQTGQLRWKKTATKTVPHEGMQRTHSYAAASPMTDGKHLYVSFGSRGIFCFDLDGNLKWEKQLGLMHTRYGWGEAASPVIHKDTLVVTWDHEGQSYLFALDAKDGSIRWKVERDEPTTWFTPLVLEHKGGTQVITPGTNRVRSYDLANGKLIWQSPGLTINSIPSPVAANGIFYCMSGYRGAACYAISLDAKGDIANSDNILWHLNKSTPYVPSPLLSGPRLYFTMRNLPVLACLDGPKGEVHFQERLGSLGDIYASPAAAAGRVYVTDRSGTTLVIRDANKFEVLAENKLGDPIDASSAIAGSQMFLRSHTNLYCLEEKK